MKIRKHADGRKSWRLPQAEWFWHPDNTEMERVSDTGETITFLATGFDDREMAIGFSLGWEQGRSSGFVEALERESK